MAGNRNNIEAVENEINIAVWNEKHLKAGIGMIVEAKNAQILPKDVNNMLEPICFRHSAVNF